ncbi:hypothetical protein CAOG_003491 [Capsaspora owczarzaki ATCC 30864]|uniref:DH domain-containing protein n=1 Tax=Capsaspora owczarzaki (strain ATCC 30864) TaxID=595528 RepID=A0A0D2WNB3_CAPO3|nr:hypothetical protein CAOG_003491 [Capsaspora owczarzaki ATCC 30864]
MSAKVVERKGKSKPAPPARSDVPPSEHASSAGSAAAKAVISAGERGRASHSPVSISLTSTEEDETEHEARRSRGIVIDGEADTDSSAADSGNNSSSDDDDDDDDGVVKRPSPSNKKDLSLIFGVDPARVKPGLVVGGGSGNGSASSGASLNSSLGGSNSSLNVDAVFLTPDGSLDSSASNKSKASNLSASSSIIANAASVSPKSSIPRSPSQGDAVGSERSSFSSSHSSPLAVPTTGTPRSQSVDYGRSGLGFSSHSPSESGGLTRQGNKFLSQISIASSSSDLSDIMDRRSDSISSPGIYHSNSSLHSPNGGSRADLSITRSSNTPSNDGSQDDDSDDESGLRVAEHRRSRPHSMGKLGKFFGAELQVGTGSGSQHSPGTISAHKGGKLGKFFGTEVSTASSSQAESVFGSTPSQSMIHELEIMQLYGKDTRHELSKEKERHWTKLVSPDVLRNLDDRTRRHNENVWELFTSEVDFMEFLLIVKECFLQPFDELQSKGYLHEVNRSSIFSNFTDILACSERTAYAIKRSLVDRLDGRSVASPSQSNEEEDHGPVFAGSNSMLSTVFVNSLFKNIESDFKDFQTYCLLHSTVLKYLKTLDNNSDFVTFLKWCQARPLCRRLQLRDLLVAPVQRLTKYPLLVQGMIKRVPADHAARLTDTCERLNRFVAQINEKINQRENYNKLTALQQSLIVSPEAAEVDGAAAVSINLLANDRKFVLEGRLSKVGSFGMYSDRHAFLFSDMLLITKPQKDQFVMYRAPIPLAELRLVHVTEDLVKHGFMVRQLNSSGSILREYTFMAENGQEKLKWIQAITEAIAVVLREVSQKASQSIRSCGDTFVRIALPDGLGLSPSTTLNIFSHTTMQEITALACRKKDLPPSSFFLSRLVSDAQQQPIALYPGATAGDVAASHLMLVLKPGAVVPAISPTTAARFSYAQPSVAVEDATKSFAVLEDPTKPSVVAEDATKSSGSSSPEGFTANSALEIALAKISALERRVAQLTELVSKKDTDIQDMRDEFASFMSMLDNRAQTIAGRLPGEEDGSALVARRSSSPASRASITSTSYSVPEEDEEPPTILRIGDSHQAASVL